MFTTKTDIAKLLSTVYGIEEIQSLAPINNGDWNIIYKVNTDADWILRISHHRKTQDQLDFELNIMSRLSQRLPFVPLIKPTITGDLFGAYQDKFCTLFEFMPGDSLRKTDETVPLAGETLGQIHRELTTLSEQQRFVNDVSMIQFDWTNNYLYSGDVLDEKLLDITVDESVRVYLEEIRPSINYLRSVRETLSKWLDHRKTEGALTEGITHGDYYRRNILMHDGTITGVVDWDECVTSWLEYEVACAAWEFSRDDAEFKMRPHRTELFLESYAAVHDLPKMDESMLTHLVAIRRLIEIQLDLYELSQGNNFDLEYCCLNLRHLRHLGII